MHRLVLLLLAQLNRDDKKYFSIPKTCQLVAHLFINFFKSVKPISITKYMTLIEKKNYAVILHSPTKPFHNEPVLSFLKFI